MCYADEIKVASLTYLFLFNFTDFVVFNLLKHFIHRAGLKIYGVQTEKKFVRV